ncbi:hypothetical protein GQ44DRAFT_792345 [Phaeosphaeriaceae sp. PMI808]|nr:hypothetical protein GQ44DRAFT_792345 [Phaeosphaeriaceae sp. PMI808]
MHINSVLVYDHEDARDFERGDFGVDMDDGEGVPTFADESLIIITPCSAGAQEITVDGVPRAQSVGWWALAKELGKGAARKVYSVTNSCGNVVAVKVVERHRRSTEDIKRQISTLESLTQEAKKAKRMHIILLEEVMGGMTSDITAGFRDIALIIKLAAYHTMESIFTGNEPERTGGTIGFLVPEQEMKQYDYGVDIWAAGIVLYMLLLGNNPLQMSYNPWSEEYKQCRERFHQKYLEMLLKLRNAYGGRDIGDLTERILRLEWARHKNGTRITVHEALDHPVRKVVGRDDGNDRPAKLARSGDNTYTPPYRSSYIEVIRERFLNADALCLGEQIERVFLSPSPHPPIPYHPLNRRHGHATRSTLRAPPNTANT